jgi:hypothetical protein
VPDLLVIVPTRSRPENVPQVVKAWRETGAFDDGAELLFAYDADDPRAPQYIEEFDRMSWTGVHRCRFRQMPLWQPLVPKLNSVAVDYADRGEHFALGFAGDDHLPRTEGWARRYVETLREVRTGIVFCDDGYRQDIPTQWAMTADIVRAIGRMVPAPVEHLYCDDAVGALGSAAGVLRYLPDVLIEHMNPYAGGKAPMDAQYARVNGNEQYRRDRAAYRAWKRSGQLHGDAAIVRALVKGEHA